jgi:hypothetical protein
LAAGFWTPVLKATFDRIGSASEGVAATSVTASPVAKERLRMPNLLHLLSPQPTTAG